MPILLLLARHADAGAALRAWDAPGCAVVVVRDDKVITLQGHGVRRAGERDPVTADTLFPISSCTKSFTSAAVALLVADGTLDWDDPVTKHLPWFRLADPLVTDAVTLRDLMCHRSGIGQHQLLWYGAPYGPEEAVRRLRHLPLSRPFRTTLQYQSTAFAAAGLAAAEASKTSWSELVQKRLLDRLAMKATYTSYPGAAKSGALSAGHRAGRPIAVADPDHADPALSMYSSARDLAAWLRYQLREPKLRETHTPQMVTRLSPSQMSAFPDTHELSYALGWAVHDYRGLKIVSHGGSIDGFRCHFALVPQKKLGVAVLCNLEQTPMPLALANAILDEQLGFPKRDWNGLLGEIDRKLRESDPEPPVRRGTTPSRELSAFAGDYDHLAYGTVSIRLVGGQLRWRWRDDVVPLDHVHYDTFGLFTMGIGPARVTFSDDTLAVTGRLGVSFRKLKSKSK